jgi:hypothetical protein
MLKHLFPRFEYRSEATPGQSVLRWVTALSDIPLQGKMLIAAVGYRRGVVSHREELIKIREGTALSVRSFVNPGPMTGPVAGLAAIQTNKQTLFIYTYSNVQTL